MNSGNVPMYAFFDPYVYQTLSTIVGTNIVVQTTQGSLRGALKTVMPDHIVVEVSGTPFFVRIQEIVWVSPAQE
ncbi:YuzF family protein [Halobacillus yeomjeoni]|uniref:YuzF family protein n=1 Tax=Halobacillus yeomjeoni TaxID=311194 RepID=A0A931MUD5_9BACI|nr:YuzF family protein [Halobacillus yeomjeoni]MBH0229154.1 YuzF family protein [Halobacillus yeomjeoni]